MNLFSSIEIIAGVSALTLALTHVGMGFRGRRRLDHQLFMVSAVSLALYAWFEHAMMHAATPAEYGYLLRWMQVPVWLVVVSVALFVRSYLQTGYTWLLWLVIAARTLAVIIDFLSPVNLNYSEISAINQVSILGEPISIAVGTPNPWMIVGQVSLFLFMSYSVYASVVAWRNGDYRRSATIGVAVIVFSLSAFGIAILVFWGHVQLPLFASPFFLGIVAAMGFELNRDIERSAKLVDDLRERDAELRDIHDQLKLSAGAADIGIWTSVVGNKTMSTSEKWKELFEFAPSQPLTTDDFWSKIHADDRPHVKEALDTAVETGNEYDTEYRIKLRSGDIRWIGSRGRVIHLEGAGKMLRGASVNITKRKLAEESVHDLSRKLINAQEKERARLARELHDDLSQRLALLSIQLSELGSDSTEPKVIRDQVRNLTTKIRTLSSDVHRISHELHPAKLAQLGLGPALGGFCREIAEARGLKVDFKSRNIPRDLADDVVLCLYRVTQESLQNVSKHSGASSASVNITAVDNFIRLTISDNGSGFDQNNARAKESLGLISMRERALSVKGSLKVDSSVNAGTKIEVCVPIRLEP